MSFKNNANATDKNPVLLLNRKTSRSLPFVLQLLTTLIAFSALLVSWCGTKAAIKSSNAAIKSSEAAIKSLEANINQYQLSSRPFLHVNYCFDPYDPPIGIEVSISGMGPAIITDSKLNFSDSVSIEKNRIIFFNKSRAYVDMCPFGVTIQTINPGTIIAEKTSIYPIKVPLNIKPSQKDLNIIIKNFSLIHVIINYESIYGEKFTATGSFYF